MRKLILVATAMLTAVGVYAQGTVNFANNSSTQVIDEADGMPVTNADGILAALYWAPLSAPNNFTQLGGSARIQSINVPSFLGVYNGGARTTGNETAAGAAAWFEVRAWDMAYASYEEALGVGKTGKTDPFMVTTGGAGTPASTPANLVGNGLTGFSVAVVPEPSVVALGLLGAGALLLIRRRK